MRVIHLYLFLILIFTVNLTKAQVVINEYSCSNISTITDNFGEYEDWVELYNPTGAAINISGYYLSDKASNPTKFQIPTGVSVPANGFLKVFCSNKNLFTAGNIHTNFKLTQTKPESIVFSDPSGAILENYVLNPTQSNHSRGRTTNGANTWSLFTTPTPNVSNTGAMQDYSTKPSFSQNSGFYTGSINVTISSPDAGVTIRYTLDGSEPTITSSLYTAPLSIAATTVVRAKAFSSNPSIPSSLINSNTYIINESHTIATLSVFGNQVVDLFNGSYIDADAGIEYFDKNNILQAEATGTTNKHGNDSWAYDQRGIDFVAIDEYGTKYALLYKLFNYQPRTEFPRLIIKALANDNYPFENGGAHIRDPYVHTLSQRGKLHLDVRTYEPCALYVNGQYWGLYDMREKVDDADFTDYYFNSKAEDVQMLKTWGSTWSEYGGAQAQTDWNTLSSFILSNNMAIPANYNHVDSLYNIKSLVDYFVLNSYVVCSDWLNWNTEWWRGINPNAGHKKWRYCLWDEDATFGHYINYTGVPNTLPTADPCNPEQLGDPGGQGHVPILNALSVNPTFKQYYVARYADLSNTVFSCQNMQFVLDSLVGLFATEMPKQIARWGGNIPQWQANLQAMKDFIDARCAALSQGMVNCYNVTGPYQVNFQVTPVNSGTIKVNSIWAPSYPWTATYYGNMLTLLIAKPNTSWIFDYWELVDSVNPDTYADSVSTTLTQNQTIIAHFKTAVPQIVLTFTSINPPCHNDTVGSIDISPSGGTSATGTYTYIWSNGATSQDLVNIPTGYYTVTVTDDIGTTATIGITITAPDAFQILTNPILSMCQGVPAVLTIAASGGVQPYSYLWNGVASTQTISVTPLVATVYTATAFDANNCPSNSATVTVSVMPPINVSLFQNTDSVCPGEQVMLTPVINGGIGPPYMMINQDGIVVSPPIFVNPTISGYYSIYVEDACGTHYTGLVYIHVITPPSISIQVDTAEGCQPLCVHFNESSLENGQTYVWNFGDNENLSFSKSPVHVFTNPGIYTVSVIVTSAYGCSNSFTNNNPITVYPKPQAQFIWNPEFASIIKPIVSFTNMTTNGYNYIWSFGDGDSSSQINPIHRYFNTGNYSVELIAISDFGCRDTATYPVEIQEELTFFAPNAFSPDGDDINDFFFIMAHGIKKTDFSFSVYSRWSEEIFKTTVFDEVTEKSEKWDGKVNNQSIAPIGSYTWFVHFKDLKGNQHEKSGSVTLIR